MDWCEGLAHIFSMYEADHIPWNVHKIVSINNVFQKIIHVQYINSYYRKLSFRKELLYHYTCWAISITHQYFYPHQINTLSANNNTLVGYWFVTGKWNTVIRLSLSSTSVCYFNEEYIYMYILQCSSGFFSDSVEVIWVKTMFSYIFVLFAD